MGEQLMAEVYEEQADGGEPLATVTGTEARVLEKAARIARERRTVVVVVGVGGAQRWLVGNHGGVVRVK